MATNNGLARLQKRLNALPKRAVAAVRLSLEKSADEIVAVMKSLVPVDKGTLRDSIGWTWGDAPKGSTVVATAPAGDLTITIYAGSKEAYYARFVEFGTSKPGHSASPFFYPAFRLGRKRVQRRTKRAIKKAIRESAGGH